MQFLVYALSYPLLWLISRLPFKALYVLSDGVYFIIYYLVGYRKKVVRENLKLVFPNQSTQWHRQIEKRFYKHLCDMFLEMIKTLSISSETMQKRFTFTNIEVLSEIEKRGKSTMVMMPHYASWEWALSLENYLHSRGFGIYQPIGNKYFDGLVRRIRAKFGTTLITTKQTRKLVAKHKEEGVLATYGIISDQSPQLSKAHYWAPFMGIEVPMHTGGELLAKKHGIPSVYLKVKKIKRGYYQATFKLLADNPEMIPDYQITDKFFKELEDSIKEGPEYYFWTHKRWKHRGKNPKKI